MKMENKSTLIKTVLLSSLALTLSPLGYAKHHKQEAVASAQPSASVNAPQAGVASNIPQPAPAALAHYQQVAAANNDELSWLGQMPATWSEDTYNQQLSAILLKLDQILSGLNVPTVDAGHFDCKAAQWSNGMFNQAAVVDYVQHSAGQMKGKAWTALINAAQNGNAIARFQVYATLSKVAGGGLVERYRALQLLDWLAKNQVGEFYYYYVQRLSASGYYAGHEPGVDAPEYIYAAQHGSYSAMSSVGALLKQSKNNKQRAIGQRMLSCANEIMPAPDKNSKN